MNSYRFSDVIFVKIRLIFVLYNADTEIERVNSMTIRKMANEELSQCVDVIRKSSIIDEIFRSEKPPFPQLIFRESWIINFFIKYLRIPSLVENGE